MAHSPHKRWKGHCRYLCRPNKHMGQGRSQKDPWNTVKKIGKKRRYTRRYLGDQD